MNKSREKRVQAGYNHLSGIYDILHRLSGNYLVKSQTQLITHLPKSPKILILGEGTGSFLKALLDHNISEEITCIDIAPKMLKRSLKKNKDSSANVKYICSEAIDYSQNKPAQEYDLIVSNFFLDQFSDINLQLIVENYSGFLNKNGYWYFTDFTVNANPVTKIFIKLLYIFFKCTCHIESVKLPDYENIFHSYGYKAHLKKNYSFGIKSILYGK